MRLFYGTELDQPPQCERCEKLESECQCPPLPREQVLPEKQNLKIAVEKRKRGKIVTVIRGLADGNDHGKLLTDLKNHCGGGGTIKENVIEIQGDHVERVKAFLRTANFKVK